MSLILNSGFTIGPGVVLDTGYTSTPSFITTGLELHLDAGDPASYPGSGTTWTDLIASKEFTLNNSPAYSSNNGGYIIFDPASSHYAQATSFPSDLSNWSLEAWHYYDPTNMPMSSSPCIITELYTGGFINFTLGNCTDSSPNLQTGHWDGGSFNATPTGHVLTSGHWYHLVGTFDGTAHRLYINGTQVAITNTTSPAHRGGGGIRLMSRWDSAQYWGGRLSIVRIYNAALGDAGVLQNFTAEQTRFGL